MAIPLKSLLTTLSILFLVDFSYATAKMDHYIVGTAGNSSTSSASYRMFLSIGEPVLGALGSISPNGKMMELGFLAHGSGPMLTPSITPTHGPTPTVTPANNQSTLVAFHGQIIDPLYFYVFPNPTREIMVHFKFYLKQNADVKLAVYTLSGDKVWSREQGYSQGWNEFFWNSTGVANGGYIYMVTASSGAIRETLRKKLALIR